MRLQAGPIRQHGPLQSMAQSQLHAHRGSLAWAWESQSSQMQAQPTPLPHHSPPPIHSQWRTLGGPCGPAPQAPVPAATFLSSGNNVPEAPGVQDEENAAATKRTSPVQARGVLVLRAPSQIRSSAPVAAKQHFT